MEINERCVVDPGRPCGACSAPGPSLCPYRYLLDADEMAALSGDAEPAEATAARGLDQLVAAGPR
ncbi:hypothetical protein [Actinoplanes teichomyceticus]|uniref:Uncharacterized protein n=1 Tax=Actinoplanes teichomyceticus TaxID=1867 RepID=A0A561VKS4_ACTTI|nr:hypothetical protein [Actinoplanes teichomyceticus]TWG12229.1 hypothetical protein FHX34_10596 [Actinoplanes teichomyceticus]GIF14164.1 hypothetical protein Ate01nite_41960 [Actinoplanes teichomyceticus]